MYTVTPIPVTLIDRVAWALDAIVRAVGDRSCPRTGGFPRLAVLLLSLICQRLRHYKARFIRYAAAHAAATMAAATAAKPLIPKPRPSRAGQQRPERPRPPTVIPRDFGWLIRLVPGARQYTSQITHLLMDPEMVALLQAHPTLGRTLRPLCWALGIRRLPNPEPSYVATLLFTPGSTTTSRAKTPPASPTPSPPSPAPPPASALGREKIPL